MLLSGVDALQVPDGDIANMYFPSTPAFKGHSRMLRQDFGDALYLQVGWLDGVGLYKNGSCGGEISAWTAAESMFSFDHVPPQCSVQLRPSGVDPLRVWVSSIKLDH